MGRRLTKEEFVERAKQIHGGKYDYGLVSYKNKETKVEIICPIHGVFKQTPGAHLRGEGCPKCGRTKANNSLRKTIEQFIEEAKQVHGNKYDYSITKYIDCNTKVKIICPIHGIFEQLPTNHLRGQGCPKCGSEIRASKKKKKKKTTEQFIEEAKQVHGNKYDYSITNVVNYSTKVKIICPIHGLFEQTPINHVKGQGCPKCADTKKTTEEFIEEAKQIHGDKYDYSMADYKNRHTKVKIICPIHGMFEQKPEDHLHGCGCKICSFNNQRTALKLFIQKANLIHHNFYNYSLVEYKNARTKVKIICPKHGIFEQTPDKHLQGQKCPKCFFSKGEKNIEYFLKTNNIEFESQKTFEDLKDILYLRYDFYLPKYNLLIEYNGGQHYKPVNGWGGYQKFLLQKHHEWLKRKYAQKHNIKLLTIPYWEFDNLETILKKEIK